MLSLFILISSSTFYEKIISNFSRTELPCRHWSSRQVTPTVGSPLEDSDDSYSCVLSRPTTATTTAITTTTTGAVVASITTFVHPPPSTPTTTSFAGSAGHSPCDWFPFSAGWRAVGLPTCRPLPRSHYGADSRGRCTNLSATPLTCVSCLLRQSSVVRWSGSSLSLSLFLLFSLSLSFSSFSLPFPADYFFHRLFSLCPSPYLFPSLSFSLSLYCFSFSLSFCLSIRLSSSTSPHAAVLCSVVSSRGTSTILSDWRQGSTGSEVHSAFTGAGRSPVYCRVKKVIPQWPQRWRKW